MPDYVASWPLWLDILPVPCFAAVVAFGIAIAATRERSEVRPLFGIVFSLALFGLVTGMMTGQSRDPAVGAVLPGVLGLVGGLVVYLAGTRDTRTMILVAALVTAFSFDLLVGAFWGSRLRHSFEDYLSGEEYRLAQEAVEQSVRLQKLLYEKKVQELRADFKLPAAEPGEPKVTIQVEKEGKKGH